MLHLSSAGSSQRDTCAAARLIVAIVLLTASTLASTAFAQDMTRFLPGPGDNAATPSENFALLYDAQNVKPVIEQCLAAKSSSGEDQQSCLNVAMATCLEFEANQTTIGSIQCAAGEEAAWRAILEGSIKRTRAKMDSGQKAALDTSQHHWLAHRDATCRIWGEVFRGGSIARQIAADCLREAAGRRALDILAIEAAFGL